MPEHNPEWDAALQALGEVIHTLRRRRNLVQDDVADHCGFHRAYLSAIERGTRNPTFLTLRCIAEMFGMKASELLAEAGL